MNPLVSVIIPCFEQGRFLSDAIDSVLAQTYRNTEIIVVNDGSTDNTSEVAGRYGDRVRYFDLPHSGPSRPRNKGLCEARGEFVQFLDADDALLPTKLEKQVRL